MTSTQRDRILAKIDTLRIKQGRTKGLLQRSKYGQQIQSLIAQLGA